MGFQKKKKEKKRRGWELKNLRFEDDNFKFQKMSDRGSIKNFKGDW